MRGTNSTSDIDAILRRLARPQLGLVSVTQATGAGIDKRALDRRRRSGALEPVFAEVMRLASSPMSAPQRVLAAGLAVPGSVIAATSAAAVHDLPVRDRVDEPIVSVGRSRSARTAGIITLRQSIELPSRRWHTARVATPAATLVLLPRFVDDGTLERCLDHCLAHRLVSVGQVRALIQRLPPRSVTGRPVLLGLLDERTAGIGHRSGLEQRVRRWLDDAGLCGWRRNLKVPVAVGPPVEVDFAWPVARVALEVSPFFTHGSRAQQERDAERRRLLTVEGWRTVEATDPDLIDQRAFGRCTAALRLLLAGDAGRVASPYVEVHLAQYNIAHLRRPLDHPDSVTYVALLDEVNALAEASPGFVWRHGIDSRDSTSSVYDDPLTLVNMSVWETPNHLRDYAYRGFHRDVFRRRGEWFDGSGAVMWWIAAGTIPTLAEGRRRLEYFERHGPTPYGFEMRTQPEQVVLDGLPSDD